MEPILFLIPWTYGFVGWITNWIALKMTFYPIRFIGFPPYLGWQGIIPRKAHKMASKSVDVITLRLLKIGEVFQKIDPYRAAETLYPSLDPLVRDSLEKFYQLDPKWDELLPPAAKEEIYYKVRRETKANIRQVVGRLQSDIDSLFDLKGLVLKKLSGDNVSLVVEIFQKVGAPEFRFIERSGFYFGFLLGIVQVLIWILFPIWWTLPLQGVVVGYLTNYLAIQMIFRPLKPKKYLGIWEYQGLFLKRQKEVSKQYSHLVAEKILNPKNIIEELVFGEGAEVILQIIEKAAREQIDRMSLLAKPLIFLSGKWEYFEKLKTELSIKISLASRDISFDLEDYLKMSMQLEETMADRMSALEPTEFESILRSAFQEEEWLLILVGGILGAFVGAMQLFIV